MLANENSKNLNYDIVIIGAGPAGLPYLFNLIKLI